MNKTYPPTGYPLLPMHIRHADDVFSQIECEAFHAAAKRMGPLFDYMDRLRIWSIAARLTMDHPKP